MIQLILIIWNTVVLLLLSAIHFYWVFGGKKWVNNAIPENYKTVYFNPKNKLKNTIATIFVAFGLIGISLITLSNYFTVLTYLPDNWIIRLTQIVAVIFSLRAIGDFNNFGLFKKKSKSYFAKYDTLIYVPLCIFLGISLLIISILNKI